MWKDEIVEDVRRVRRELAARFGNDIKAIVENARKEQKMSGRKIVSGQPRKAKKPVVEKV